MKVLEGSSTPPSGRFAIVAARFNHEIVQKLVDGALDAFRRLGVADDALDLAWVPGAFEIPLVARQLAASGRYAAVVALGAVVKGDTDHYEYVARAAATGVAQAALETGVPVLLGVLTCATWEQALERAGGKEGNKGADAAVAAIEMAALLRELPG